MLRLIFRFLLLIVNVITALWLLLCTYAAYYDTSDKASVISLLSYTLPFALIGNYFFILFWIFFSRKKKKLYSLISILCLLISWPVTKSVIGVNPFGNNQAQSDAVGAQMLKVLTYNVHLFDLGGWTKDNTTQKKIVDFIREENPDILCLQEFYLDPKDPKQPFTEVISNLGYPYVEFTKQSDIAKRRMTSQAAPGEKLSIGLAVFSKYPLKDKKDINIPGRNRQYKVLSTDVEIREDFTLKLIVAHLQSFSLDGEDREFIEKVKDNPEINKEKEQEAKSLLRKMILASHYRAQQANTLVEIIRSHQRTPLILCGDFNDVPGSYVYQSFSRELSDPFLKKGFGFGRTYSFIAPTLRIDHILYNPQFLKPISYDITKQNMSDHYPLAVEFTLLK